MRIYLVSILVTLFFISCEDEKIEEVVEIKNENPLGLCDNEIELLKSDVEEEIVFDFEQCMECVHDSGGCNVFGFIEEQKKVDLCDLRLNFSSVFDIDNGDTIRTNLVADKVCNEFILAHPMIEEVLINNKHQILAEGEFIVANDSLKYEIARILKADYDTYGKLTRGRVYYSLRWDDQVDIAFRKYVFKEIICAYLIVANGLSQNNFNSDLCSLNKDELDSIKTEFNFNLLLTECEYVVTDSLRVPCYSD